MTPLYRRYYDANQRSHVGAIAMLALALAMPPRSRPGTEPWPRDHALFLARNAAEIEGFDVSDEEFAQAGAAFDRAISASVREAA